MHQNPDIEMIITPRQRDLGGFSVRRVLPYMHHHMVGPFIFFDHMGPADFAPGHGIDVRPHPHIGLATVSYLFEGRIQHRDSLGSNLIIEPGAINWMTAGRGIVHSERTPEPLRLQGGRLNGIQLWVALPNEHEETSPQFSHHPADTLPEFKVGDVDLKLLLGEAFGRKSPVPVLSRLFYLEAKMPAKSEIVLKADGQETAIYVVSGRIRIGADTIETYSMAVAKSGVDLKISADEKSKLMLIGGATLGPRNIEWNFVSSSKERLEEVKAEWVNGPLKQNPRFHPVPDDNQEFIPLPVGDHS
jgi:redox-sensitive bicupin YhaK (pirin superfamily)